MILTIEYLQKSIKDTQEELKAIEVQLSSTLSPEGWTSLKVKTDKILIDYKKVTEERKRNKFLRNADDYTNNRIYKWTESNRTSR